jgi:predicted regulator of Ras-like GTPase activity (Roadblock/LC7/MglB family)
VETLLQRLMAIEGVTGALLVSRDGAVRASTLTSDEEELIGAMAAAAFDAANRYVGQLGMGDVGQALFETARGVVQVADAGDTLVVVRCADRQRLGRVRLELLQARSRLTGQGGR